MSAAPRPGWYPDPAGTSELYRWWDGAGWTDAISESPRAPSPRTSLPAEAGDELARRRPSRFRAVVALVLCLALFLSATVGVGLIIWHDPPMVKRGSRQPASTPATPAASLPTGLPDSGSLDEKTREARIGAATMRLPEAPYGLMSRPMTVAGLLDVFFIADAPVHPAYDGSDSWSSAVLLGRLAGPGAESDLRTRADETLQGLSRTFYRSRATRLDHVVVADHAVDGHPGLQVTARVHYDIERLPSRYDELTAVLVGLDDGSVVAAVSSVPNDADSAVTTCAAASLRTLAIG
ncbi:DUF2510 domain-containing protein [uncultured Friedmanniella sp.]|uniref:DUF2510 domain-containing protein n=1 Tax=uncultured Friedmanniella sp. TaxID=335381 RepID=UPI0035CBC6BE